MAAAAISAEDKTLSLSEAINLALVYDAGIKAASSESAAATMTYRAAQATRFPTLAIDARSGYVDNVPEAAIGFQTIELGTRETYQADFKLSLPIFTGGRISGAINAADQRRRAEASRLDAEKMTVAYNCRRAYLQLLLADASVKIAEASLKRLDVINENVHHLYESGIADSIDILEAALAVEQGKQVLDRQKFAYNSAEAALRNSIGLWEGRLSLAEPIELPKEKPLTSMTIHTNLRPELQSLEHLARAAEYSADLAGAGNFPTLTTYAGYSVGKPNRDMFNKDWDNYFSVGLTVNWQFNLAGQTAKSASAARRQAEGAAETRRNLERALWLQYSMSLDNLNHAFNIIAITEREYDMARRKFHLASQRQKAGQLTVNRLVEMEAELTAIEQQHRSAVIQYYLTQTEFFYSYGAPEIFGGLQ